MIGGSSLAWLGGQLKAAVPTCFLRVRLSIPRRHSGGEFPAFVFHFLVGPVLEFFEQGGLYHCEADADAAFVAYPDHAGFGLKYGLAFGQSETQVQQS